MSGPIAAVSTTISAMNERRPPRRPDLPARDDSPSEQSPEPDGSAQPIARPSPLDEAPAATLFSTSLIAGRMPLYDAMRHLARSQVDWAPPESPLRLRDKTI